MAKLITLLKEYIISLGDPREPAKVFLGEIWDNILPPKDQIDLLVEAIYKAILIESGNREVVWTEEALRKLIAIETNDIDLKNLDSQILSKQLEKAFCDVAFVPERTHNKFDFEQITKNVIKIAFAEFDRKLREPENQKLRLDLIERHARNTGLSINQIESTLESLLTNTAKELRLLDNKLDNTLVRTVQLEEDMSGLKDSLQSIDNTLLRIAQTVSLLNNPVIDDPGTIKISGRERKTNLVQLNNYRLSLEAYKISWSRYVSQRDIPVQDLREVIFITSKVDELIKSLDIDE